MSIMDPSKNLSEDDKPLIESISNSMATLASSQQQHPPPSPLSGCYLLVVLPEPHTAQHKEIILNRLSKGFLSWDKDDNHVDLEKELQALVTQSPEGEEARNGERLIQYATENLVSEILIHPQTNTLLQCIRNLLASFTKHRHIIHAGYTFGENGSWILQDGTFSAADFLDAFSEHDVQRVLHAYENSVTVDIHCSGIGEWSSENLSKESCTRSCRIRINPPANEIMKKNSIPAINNFINYIGQYIVPQTLDDLMEPSDVVGNIRFSHPTLYVFPGGQGDAALFGINGFNMLVDGGFSRKSCFWDFTRHLDRLDAVLFTRINNSNIGGMASILNKKKQMQVYPQIGHFFCNLNVTDRNSKINNKNRDNNIDNDDDYVGDNDDDDNDYNKLISNNDINNYYSDKLIINLLDIGKDMMFNLKHINLRPHSCYRNNEPINLYHKVGHGTLDMYVISPSKDSREVKEFLNKWNKNDFKLFSGTHKKDINNMIFPIQNLISICALLVWQPANPDDTITRILFPGSTPQNKIFEGINHLKNLEFLKYPTCTAQSISPTAITLTKLKDKSKKQIISQLNVDKEKRIKRDLGDIKKDKDIIKSKKLISSSALVENKKLDESNKVIESKIKLDKDVKKELKKDVVKDKDNKKPAVEVNKVETEQRKKPKVGLKQSKIDTSMKIDNNKKPKVSTPKKIDVTPKVQSKISKSNVTTPPAKPSNQITPAKSAKDANNRKVVEQKNIERMSALNQTTKTMKSKAQTSDKKSSTPRRSSSKPISSPSKRFSPVKTAQPPPAKTSGSTKPQPIRRIKTDKSSTPTTAATTSAAAVTTTVTSTIAKNKINVASDVDKPAEKFIDKCLTEKSEDMSFDSIESKVLADLKEERQVAEEIEAVLQKAELIEGVKTKELDKKEEDVTEDDVTADIDEIQLQKSISRKTSHELTEEDEYLIIEKEEIYITEDQSVQSASEEVGRRVGEDDEEDRSCSSGGEKRKGEVERKHLLDAVQSEKVKKDKVKAGEVEEDEEYIENDDEEEEEDEDVEIDDEDEEGADEDEVEEEEEEGGELEDEDEERDDEDEDEYDEGIEKEVCIEKGDVEGQEKTDAPEKQVRDLSEEFDKSEERKKADDHIVDGKKMDSDVKGLVKSPGELAKKDKKDLELELVKDTESSLSQEKLDSSDKKTTDTMDLIKPDADVEMKKEKLDESQEKISTIESGATTTAPTLPEDERISIESNKVMIPSEKTEMVEEQIKKMETTTAKVTQLTGAAVPPMKEPILAAVSSSVSTAPAPTTTAAVITTTVPSKTMATATTTPLPIPVSVPIKTDPDVKEFNVRQIIPQSMPRDIVKTPDEVADLPVHEEVDPKLYKMDDYEKNKEEKIEEKVEKETKDHKGMFSFFGKVADKFEKGIDKLTGKHRKGSDDNERDVDEKSSKSESPKELAIKKDAIKDIVKEKIDDVKGKIEDVVKEKIEDVKEKIDDKIAGELDEVKEVEALLEEASKKFKDVKDSLRDSLESLEEKIIDEHLKPIESPTKDVIQETLDEVVEKLEGIKPQMVTEMIKKVDDKVDAVLEDIEEQIVKKDEEKKDVKEKDIKEAVKDVGEVLAGTAGIILDERPKDVVEIVKKVAEVLRDDDFLPKPISVDKKPADDEISIKKEEVKDVCLAPSSPDGKTGAKLICDEILQADDEDDKPPKDIQVDSEVDLAKKDVLKAGIEHVCEKVCVQHKPDAATEIEAEISIERKLTPDRAEIIIVSPDSMPTSPKFVDKKDHDVDKSAESKVFIVPDEIKIIIDSYDDTYKIIEEIITVRKTIITKEIVEYILTIKRVPRKRFVDIVSEIITLHKIPPGNVIEDLDLLKEGEVEEIEEDEVKKVDYDAKTFSDIELLIEREFIRNNVKIDYKILQNICDRKSIPVKVIIEIIEEIIIKRKIPRKSLLSLTDEELKKIMEKKVEKEDEQLVEELTDVIETRLSNEFITKNKKIDSRFIETIHRERNVPTRIIIEIIEMIIIRKKLVRSSIVGVSEADWDRYKSEGDEDEIIDGFVSIPQDKSVEDIQKASEKQPSDGFEAVEQEYKIKMEVDTKEAVDEADEELSEVVEAEEKIIPSGQKPVDEKEVKVAVGGEIKEEKIEKLTTLETAVIKEPIDKSKSPSPIPSPGRKESIVADVCDKNIKKEDAEKATDHVDTLTTMVDERKESLVPAQDKSKSPSPIPSPVRKESIVADVCDKDMKKEEAEKVTSDILTSVVDERKESLVPTQDKSKSPSPIPSPIRKDSLAGAIKDHEKEDLKKTPSPERELESLAASRKESLISEPAKDKSKSPSPMPSPTRKDSHISDVSTKDHEKEDLKKTPSPGDDLKSMAGSRKESLIAEPAKDKSKSPSPTRKESIVTDMADKDTRKESLIGEPAKDKLKSPSPSPVPSPTRKESLLSDVTTKDHAKEDTKKTPSPDDDLKSMAGSRKESFVSETVKDEFKLPSPIRKDSLISDGIGKEPEKAEIKKTPSPGDELKSGLVSRKESIISEPAKDKSKSPSPSPIPSPIRKESLIGDKIDAKDLQEELKKAASPDDDLKSVAGSRKESLISETAKDKSKSPSPVPSPTRKESVAPDVSDKDDRKASLISEPAKDKSKSPSPSPIASPIRKESLIGDKIGAKDEKEDIKKSASPDDDLKSIAGSRKESLIIEPAKDKSTSPSPVPSPTRKESVAVDVGVKDDRKASLIIEPAKDKSPSPSPITSPIRKESLVGDKIDTQAITDELKKAGSPEDALKLVPSSRKESLIIEPAKDKSKSPSPIPSPTRKESIAPEVSDKDDIKTSLISEPVKDKSKSPSPSPIASPIRKESLVTDKIDTQVVSEELKKAASPEDTMKSIPSSRKESLIIEPAKDKSKSPSPLPSPTRKESIVADVCEKDIKKEIAETVAAHVDTLTAVIDARKESLVPTLDKSKSPSPIPSPTRKDSLVTGTTAKDLELELRKIPSPQEDLILAAKDKSKSPSPMPSPTRKDSHISDISTKDHEKEDLKKTPSPDDALKSVTESRKESLIAEPAKDKSKSPSPLPSPTRKDSHVSEISTKDHEKEDLKKTPSPDDALISVAESRKDSLITEPAKDKSKSPSPMPSPTRKDSHVSEISIKDHEKDDLKKIPSPDDDLKSIASSRKESLIAEPAKDKSKSPSPVPSPTRKESIVADAISKEDGMKAPALGDALTSDVLSRKESLISVPDKSKSPSPVPSPTHRDSLVTGMIAKGLDDLKKTPSPDESLKSVAESRKDSLISEPAKDKSKSPSPIPSPARKDSHASEMITKEFEKEDLKKTSSPDEDLKSVAGSRKESLISEPAKDKSKSPSPVPSPTRKDSHISEQIDALVSKDDTKKSASPDDDVKSIAGSRKESLISEPAKDKSKSPSPVPSPMRKDSLVGVAATKDQEKKDEMKVHSPLDDSKHTEDSRKVSLISEPAKDKSKSPSPSPTPSPMRKDSLVSGTVIDDLKKDDAKETLSQTPDKVLKSVSDSRRESLSIDLSRDKSKPTSPVVSPSRKQSLIAGEDSEKDHEDTKKVETLEDSLSVASSRKESLISEPAKDKSKSPSPMPSPARRDSSIAEVSEKDDKKTPSPEEQLKSAAQSRKESLISEPAKDKSKSPSPMPSPTRKDSHVSDLVTKDHEKEEIKKTPSPDDDLKSIASSRKESLMSEHVLDKSKSPSPIPSPGRKESIVADVCDKDIKKEDAEKVTDHVDTLTTMVDEKKESLISALDKSKSPSPIPSPVRKDSIIADVCDKDMKKEDAGKITSDTLTLVADERKENLVPTQDKSKSPSPIPSPIRKDSLAGAIKDHEKEDLKKTPSPERELESLATSRKESLISEPAKDKSKSPSPMPSPTRKDSHISDVSTKDHEKEDLKKTPSPGDDLKSMAGSRKESLIAEPAKDKSESPSPTRKESIVTDVADKDMRKESLISEPAKDKSKSPSLSPVPSPTRKESLLSDVTTKDHAKEDTKKTPSPDDDLKSMAGSRKESLVTETVKDEFKLPSPIRKDSIATDAIGKEPEKEEIKKTSPGDELKSGLASRKESIISEPATDKSKSPSSSPIPSPIRKESLIGDKIDAKDLKEELKKAASPDDDLKSVAGSRKESLISETIKDKSKSPSPVPSPTRKESVAPDVSVKDDRKASPISEYATDKSKSPTPSPIPSPIRKKSLIGDKIVAKDEKEDIKKSASPDDDLKSIADSRKESLINEPAKDKSKSASPVQSPTRKESVAVEVSDKDDTKASLISEPAKDKSKSPSPSPIASPIRKESLVADKIDTQVVSEELKKAASPEDALKSIPSSRKESLIIEPAKDKSKSPSPLPSPTRKESIATDECVKDIKKEIAETVAAHVDTLTAVIDARKESLVPTLDKSKSPSPIPSPTRKDSLVTGTTAKDLELELKKIPSPQEDLKLAAESRKEILIAEPAKDKSKSPSPMPSPTRKDSHISELSTKDHEKEDLKKTPSPDDALISVAESRKDSLITEPAKDKSKSPSPMPSPTRKDSHVSEISIKDHEKDDLKKIPSPDDDLKSIAGSRKESLISEPAKDKSKSPSPVPSPTRKESVVDGVIGKEDVIKAPALGDALPSDVLSRKESLISVPDKTKSPSPVPSPTHRDSLATGMIAKGLDDLKKTPSPDESLKSVAESRKESLISEPVKDKSKSPSPIPSPARKDSHVSEMITKELEKENLKKTSSPDEDLKSVAGSRKESLISEPAKDKSPSPIPSPIRKDSFVAVGSTKDDKEGDMKVLSPDESKESIDSRKQSLVSELTNEISTIKKDLADVTAFTPRELSLPISTETKDVLSQAKCVSQMFIDSEKTDSSTTVELDKSMPLVSTKKESLISEPMSLDKSKSPSPTLSPSRKISIQSTTVSHVELKPDESKKSPEIHSHVEGKDSLGMEEKSPGLSEKPSSPQTDETTKSDQVPTKILESIDHKLQISTDKDKVVLMESEVHLKDDKLDAKKTPSPAEDSKSVAGSRKESLISEPAKDKSKSPSPIPSPIRRDSHVSEVVAKEDETKVLSSDLSKASSGSRKESLISEPAESIKMKQEETVQEFSLPISEGKDVSSHAKFASQMFIDSEKTGTVSSVELQSKLEAHQTESAGSKAPGIHPEVKDKDDSDAKAEKSPQREDKTVKIDQVPSKILAESATDKGKALKESEDQHDDDEEEEMDDVLSRDVGEGIQSRDRSRSHSLYETGDRTPLTRSRAASLYSNKEEMGLSKLQHPDDDEEDDGSGSIDDQVQVKQLAGISSTKRTDIERYISSQYILRKKKISKDTLEQIISLYDVSQDILIDIIDEICNKMRINKETIIDFDEQESKDDQSVILSQISFVKRLEIENYIDENFIKPKKKMSMKIIEEIVKSKNIPLIVIITITKYLIISKKIPRESLLDESVVLIEEKQDDDDDEDDGKSEKEDFDPEVEEQVLIPEKKRSEIENYIIEEYINKNKTINSYLLNELINKMKVSKYIIFEVLEEIIKKMKLTREVIYDDSIYSDLYYKERISGKSTPDFKSSEHSTPDKRYDESQFHKAFIDGIEMDGLTEMRTTHITTLSGSGISTPGRTNTPDSISSEVVSKKDELQSAQSQEAQPEYDTIVKKTVIKREIVVEEEEDDECGGDDDKVKKMIVKGDSDSLKHKDVELLKGQDKSSGRSTPEEFCSSEVIRTTITTTRTVSEDGEIVTTTKEVTETTNDKGETKILAEKVNVKVEDKPETFYDKDSGDDAGECKSKDRPQGGVFSSDVMSSSVYGSLPSKDDIKEISYKVSSSGDAKDDGDDDGDFTFKKKIEIRQQPQDDDDDDDDPIKEWGTPLKLPTPVRPDKFNLRSGIFNRNTNNTTVDISPDSLDFDLINDWGEPMRLPSPTPPIAPTIDESSNKNSPSTPTKKQTKKVISENVKNKKYLKSDNKTKDLKKIQPIYLDLTYVPHHGNSYYASLEFFKRIRARYYIFSGIEPSREVYDALLNAKKTWEDKNLEVTIIPTYDTDTLGYWVADNEEALAANHIDLSPSASRCTINLQDHETSCNAYRLEF